MLAGPAGAADDWLSAVQSAGFWDRLKMIKGVSQLSESEQIERVPDLVQLLKDQDQSVRITAAEEIAELGPKAERAIPQLIDNFTHENGEEGQVYVSAVASFGASALPRLLKAFNSSNWLVKARASDAIRIIQPQRFKEGDCSA